MIGNGGGGKTVLSAELARRLGVPHHEVDLVQFREDWARVPEGEVARVLDGWLDGDGWVIDGFGPFRCIERRLAAADTIVWIDYPLRTHLRWAAKRQLFGRARPTVRLVKAILHVHGRYRPGLEAELARHGDRVVRLRSPREMRRWLEDPRPER